MKCCVSFMPDIIDSSLPKSYTFVSVSPQSIFPKVLGVIQMFFGKCEVSLVIFSVSSLLGTPLFMPFLPSLFLIFKTCRNMQLLRNQEVGKYFSSISWFWFFLSFLKCLSKSKFNYTGVLFYFFAENLQKNLMFMYYLVSYMLFSWE